VLPTGWIVVAGEITTTANVDISEVARQTVKDVGTRGRSSDSTRRRAAW
jgi:S-adenosylmethionine synthetase